MPPRITNVQRQAILQMLAQGVDRHAIANQTGVTPGQVSAVIAHVKMGTYALPTDANVHESMNTTSNRSGTANAHASENLITERDSGSRPGRLLKHFPQAIKSTPSKGDLRPVYLGADAESTEDVYWNPDPQTGTANPHVLVLGE